MGRPRKPIERHLAEGTYRRDRHGELPVLLAGRSKPVPPASLKGEARRVFVSIAKAGAAIFDAADSSLIEGAAVMTVRARVASADISRRGVLVVNRHGAEVVNPSVRVERDALTELRLQLSALGMSPAARARLGGLGVEGKSPVEELPGLGDAAKLRVLAGGKKEGKS